MQANSQTAFSLFKALNGYFKLSAEAVIVAENIHTNLQLFHSFIAYISDEVNSRFNWGLNVYNTKINSWLICSWPEDIIFDCYCHHPDVSYSAHCGHTVWHNLMLVVSHRELWIMVYCIGDSTLDYLSMLWWWRAKFEFLFMNKTREEFRQRNIALLWVKQLDSKAWDH